MKKIRFSVKAKITAQTGLLALLVGAACALPQQASAVGPGDADTMFNGFNNAFLVNGNYYKTYDPTNGTTHFDRGWSGALDIQVAEDVYERTGNAAHKNLVNALCTTWVQNWPPGYTWDGWNDDIGWQAIMLARGYLITGNANLLNEARVNNFDMAWARGWDTQYNGGGIWEQQPEKTPAGQTIDKEALSNDSLGKAACYIYQGNHDQWYLDRATQIYDWMWHHLYNPNTGQVYNGVDRNNVVNTGRNVYNQGTFADYAELLYKITGNVNYFNDAKKALDYVKNTWYNGGIMTGGGTNTWSDEYARGIGHFCRDNPGQWGTYYNWMVLNSNAAWSHRRTDYNICWSDFSQQTPGDNNIITNRFCDAAAWLQYTPATQPGGGGGNSIAGLHSIFNVANGLAIDNGSTNTVGAGVVQWGNNGGGSSQKWTFTQNSDTSWCIVSQYSGQALDNAGSTTNGSQVIQYPLNAANVNQRWWVDVQPDGTYKIWSKMSSQSLDDGNKTNNGAPLIQWPVANNNNNQRWRIQ